MLRVSLNVICAGGNPSLRGSVEAGAAWSLGHPASWGHVSCKGNSI